VKMIRTAKALKIWRQKRVGNIKVQMAIIQIVLTLLEKAQESRQLSSDELFFHRQLKIKMLGLAAIQKTRARQHSRQTWMRLGEANTRLFHLMANNIRHRNFIRTLHQGGRLLTSQVDKINAAHQYFLNILGNRGVRHCVLKWENLGYTPFDLSDLDSMINEIELKNVIMGMQSEKAPGPDGFIGLFYKYCFEMIREDLTNAVNDFYHHKCKNLHLVNDANIILLPKREQADRIELFRPISLINSFMKIITKILANRLAPRMNEIVPISQNAFIQKRSIHDNFLYVQRVIRKLHKNNQPALFIKLDISKAFDSLNWAYLLDVLGALGFSLKWRNWIASILGTSSSKIMINGKSIETVQHLRGVRQGDPLSPFLFILAIDPLQKMIEMASDKGILKRVLPKGAKLRCSLYADDAGVFIRPDKHDLQVLKKILEIFERCSGLKINFEKIEIYPIRYPNNLWTNLMEVFPDKYSSFPGKYLGLPLHYRNVKRIEVQPLIDKIRKRLAGWKGRLLSKAGRETLVKSVLSAQQIYHLTVFPVQKWLLRHIDKIRRSFLWKGEEPEFCSGGHCLVNWSVTCLPKNKGGLGILDLERFARALRLRWL
jgi:hypothetical protein